MKAVKRKEPHPHAELIRQYAEDEIGYEQPYCLWELKTHEEAEWLNASTHPSFTPSHQYRRKPETITVTFEMPIPDLDDHYFKNQSDLYIFLKNYKAAVDKAMEEL